MTASGVRKKNGFTIVELLIVIVVIAILASISIVAYNGIQNRAQDVQIRSVAQQIVKATQAWGVTAKSRTSIGGGSSSSYVNGVCVGGGGGWFSRSVGSYGCTIDRVLVDAGVISADLALSVPRVNKMNTASYGTFMLYPCGGSGEWVFMYALNTADDKELTSIRTKCAGSPSAAYVPIDTWGMSGGIIFNPETS